MLGERKRRQQKEKKKKGYDEDEEESVKKVKTTKKAAKEKDKENENKEENEKKNKTIDNFFNSNVKNKGEKDPLKTDLKERLRNRIESQENSEIDPNILKISSSQNVHTTKDKRKIDDDEFLTKYDKASMIEEEKEPEYKDKKKNGKKK